MFKMASEPPEPSRQASGVDLSTFLDVMRTEDNSRFEQMFMTQDEPLQQILSENDTENSEEVYNLVKGVLKTEAFTPLQFQMLQRIFAGTGFYKKHGHHETQFRTEHFKDFGELTPHYSGLSMKHQMSIRLDEPSTPLYGLQMPPAL